MTERYALVDEAGRVADVVLWDGVAGWSPPEGLTALAAPSQAGPGWRLDEGAWSPPEAA